MGGGGAGVGEEQPSRLREEKVGISGLPLTSPCVSQKQKAVKEGGGESDEEKDPAEHWWPPQPGKPGEHLVHLGDGGNVQVTRRS